MKGFFLRVLLSCALLPPGRIYLFYKGENAQRVADVLRENCDNQFVQELQKTYLTPDEEIKEMEDLFSAGKDAFEAVEFEKAIVNIENALSIFKKNMIFMKDFKEVITPIAILGICYLALGKKDDALRTFRYLLSIRPDYKPSETLFPPSAMETFLRAKRKIKKFEFFFTTFPEGATVYIDGRKSGITPYSEKGMPEGTHLIVAYLSGYKEFREVMEVSKNETLSVILEKSDFSIPDGWWEMGQEELLKVCKGRCPSPSLFLYSYPEGTSEVVGVFYSEEKSSFSVIKIGEKDFPSQVSAFISLLFEERKEKPEKKSIPEIKEIKSRDLEEEKPSRWYLWTALGILAVGGGIGIYFGTRKEEKTMKFLITW